MLHFAIELRSLLPELISFKKVFGNAIVFLWIFDEILCCRGVLLPEEINVYFDGVGIRESYPGDKIVEEPFVIFYLHLAHYKSIMNINFNIATYSKNHQAHISK